MSFDPPVEYLFSTSDTGLDNFAMNRLTHAANLRKEIKQMESEIRTAEREADLATWLKEHRQEILQRMADGPWVKKTEAA